MRKFESEALQVIYEDAESLYEDGIITIEQLHEFDDCLITESAAPVAVPRSPVTSGAAL
jgi:hypothetical protein